MSSIEWDGHCVKAPSEQYDVSIQTSTLTVRAISGNYILANKRGKAQTMDKNDKPIP